MEPDRCRLRHGGGRQIGARTGRRSSSGVEIPGLGKAVVDVDNKQIRVQKIMIVNKDTVDGLIKQGL